MFLRSSLARAELDQLPPEVADQARFIIQAQALIDPERPGNCAQALLPLRQTTTTIPDVLL